MHKDCPIEQWNEVCWTDESKWKNFESNRRVYMQWRVGERTATPCITLSVKQGGGSVMVCVWCVWGGILPVAKSGICNKGRINWIKLAITAYCSIMRSYLEHGLLLKDLYSYKIMTQSILVNSARGTLKVTRNSSLLQLMSWLAQSADLNPIELVWDELGWKVRAKQPTSVAHLWQLLQKSWAEVFSVYSQSLVERIQRIWSSDGNQSGSFWWVKSLRSFCVNLYLMWLRKTCI